MEHSLRVVTWNVWGRYGPWLERAPRITEALQRLDPDVVCLQEVWTVDDRTQADALAEDLSLHAVFDRTRMPAVEAESGADGLGMAVLARWPVLDRQRHELPMDLPGDPTSLLIATFLTPRGRCTSPPPSLSGSATPATSASPRPPPLPQHRATRPSTVYRRSWSPPTSTPDPTPQSSLH